MEERKLVDIEEVKDVLGDTINSEGEETVKKMKPLEEVEQEDLDHVYKEGYKAGYARAMLDYGLED